ncbi:FERM, ARHGEF and pleckstrin domain-containing protein 1 isoform X2 [Leguminivora glycinivorella]|uniref:FERM, ARHGEF and pleckstrin domain-containing protein 1 isoform X2 n=1 Tax=Leguminivora glycinivorella TaxID=1035111 RepID=UPI00200D6967|nr:FERM, ARHGEF and pleckstrin domain-containing protein 1 isoform X2 [Leguminivora glycinivorella]
MESDLPPGSCNSTGHLSTIGYHTLPGRMHHSASTPAGVDGAGGGSRTPPATPKKGGKMLAIRVQMLDDTISMFQIQSKAVGRVLFDQVCRQLHLLEADYFGLEYQDANGTRYWLDVEKPMCRQVGLSMLEPTLRFCVKFYTPDPARLEEEFTRYLFCLQVKRDLAQGCIQCNENTAALLASYIVQAECGDFVPEDYPDHTYLSGYKFFPGQDSESERRIMENHKKHSGQSPAEADMNLLETARRCELYGVKMHPAKDHEAVPLNLAVAHLGILVFQNFTKINTFSWAKIRKISFKRKKFLIKLHPEGYGYHRDIVEFFFEGRNECKNFWKKCVENHGFFRCSSVPRIQRHKTRVMSRGSSFRYSGKTQKQIVEFVRDNYVKRQTFQRSGSFRASRSLRSSRGNVSQAPAQGTLNASVSAHPLLPLPPGSDAISLEWDKQPHYLEASLMMKGYTAEEAAQAARRTRRPSEGAPRPPLTATAYAATRDKGAPELVTRAEVNHHPTEDSPLPLRTTTPLVSPESIWSQASSCRANGRARAPTPPPRAPRPAADECSLEEEKTVSSASLCMSPSTTSEISPLCASTPVADGACAAADPRPRTRPPRGPDHLDNAPLTDAINGNANLVSESTSMDVLSGGESDAGDTLNRRNNNNSIWTRLSNSTLREGAAGDTQRRRGGDVTFFIARELLMTERTYKRDLELVTVAWSARVSELGGAGAGAGGGEAAADVVAALARPCLALEPLALAQGGLLARLERALAARASDSANITDGEEPEYKKIAELLCDYLTNTYDAYAMYTERSGALVGVVESVRRRSGAAARAAQVFEAAAPLPLACLLLRPLHRLLYYATIADEITEVGSLTTGEKASGAGRARAALEVAARLARAAARQLRHVENHAALCQLQRDIVGYDKLLVAEREFIRMGCVYKHSSKGLQQRMLFLLSDVAVLASKSGSAAFRAHCALPLRALRLARAPLPHSFTLCAADAADDEPDTDQRPADDSINLMLSTSNEVEFDGWYAALEAAIERAQELPGDVDTELTPYEQDTGLESGGAGVGGGALTHVCWHRVTSLTREHLHTAMRSQMSGYLLRKFKNSHGWQKLWVVFAAFTLFFYKSWHDEAPLASLPLLGYTVGAPSEKDAIFKDFVFKLQFKNHVYFFRADSQFTYNSWNDVLKTAMVQQS